jgi:hypothetical protein
LRRLGAADLLARSLARRPSPPSLSTVTPRTPFSLKMAASSSPRSRRLIWIGLIVLFVVAAAIAIPVGITQANKGGGSSSSTTQSSGSGSAASPGANNVATSGVDGSTVMLDSGIEIQYVNSFGGDWRLSLADAEEGGILRGGRPNNWTPRIGDKWTWGQDIARGVSRIPSSLPAYRSEAAC